MNRKEQMYKKLLDDIIESCNNSVYCFKHVGEFSDLIKDKIQTRLKIINNK
jgi:hypothetical protein